ncbi:hypothetical protein SERLADRAFT_394381, partial [Serpula lacrymans var. lacrymans S7.9]
SLLSIERSSPVISWIDTPLSKILYSDKLGSERLSQCDQLIKLSVLLPTGGRKCAAWSEEIENETR